MNTLVLRRGLLGTVNDTYIAQESVNTNYGTVTMRFGSRYPGPYAQRMLVKFSLALLPDDAIISSAMLKLYLNTTGTEATNVLNVYRLKRDWVEGQATWNIYKTGSSWQTAGGFGANDCDPTVVGTYTFSNPEPGGFKNIALTGVSKAELDFGNGWLIRDPVATAGDWRSFLSSEYTTNAAYRPTLTIVYEVPGAAITRAPYWGRF